MRKEITIPGAGESRNFSIKGVSLIIESIPVYSGHEEVPVLGFNQPGANYPLYTYSTYNAGGQQFKNISITGTAESAGDTVVIISVYDCLPIEIKPGFVSDAALGGGELKTVIKKRFQVATTDAAQNIVSEPDFNLLDGNGYYPRKMYVMAAQKDIRYSLEGVADQTGNHFILKVDDTPQVIAGFKNIKKFNFASAVAAAAGNLIAELEYPVI